MPPARVMVVEDDPVVATEVVQLVSALGFIVAGVAPGASEAIRMATERRPDVVLVELALRRDRLRRETVRRLQASLDTPMIHIITPDELPWMRELPGPVLTVLRPIEPDLLRSHIDNAVHWRRNMVALQASNESLKRAVENLVEAQALARVGSWDEDLATGEFHVSEECLRLHGLEPGITLPALAGLLETVETEDRHRLDELLRNARSNNRPYETEYRVRTAAGLERLLHHRLAIRRGAPGEPQQLIATVRDITEQRRAEEALRHSEERASRHLEERDFILENTRDVLYYIDHNGLVYYVSPAVEELTGYKPEEWVGHFTALLVDSESNRRAIRETEDMLRTGREYPPSIIEFRHKSGGSLLGEVSERPIVKDGQVMGLVGVARDVTERVQAENRLRQAAVVFENTLEAIILTDRDKHISAVNRAFAQITGYTEAEVLGRTPDFLAATEEDALFRQDVWRSVERAERWSGEMWDRRKSGEIFPAWVTVSTIRNDTGDLTNYVSVLSDLSHQKESEEKLDLLAHYDPLTHLPNRLLFTSRLAHAIRHAERHRREVALLYIDLDHFKKINDTFGHPTGDRLLQKVARRLTSLLRKEDTVARLGGDEFVIILEDLQDVDNVSDVARKALNTLSQPYRFNSQSAVIAASMGISIYPQDGLDVTRLVQSADMAMYRAKELGRGGFQYCTAELTARASERLILENAMRAALSKDEFVLYYQPQVDLASSEVVGVEALIRWHHPERGLVLPGVFIPLGEETGLIEEMGEWVLNRSCSQAKEWQESGAKPVILAVNVSAYQLARTSAFVDTVSTALAASGLDPRWLELEITESAIMRNPEESARVICDLKSLGISVAIDDFGTGYSSMGYLKRFTIDKLKTARAFVRDLPTDDSDRAITRAIIALGHSLRMKVLAEGVETEEQQRFLREQGCDEMQGFLFSPPIPEPEFRRMLLSRHVH